jgi:DNA primase large subunit
MATTKQTGAKRNSNGKGNGKKREERDEALRRSPMMAHLLDAVEEGTDVGHYGRLVFAMVARHFMEEDRLVELLSKQPEQDEEQAQALVRQVEGRDYNPPRRERILEWQAQQEFPICPTPDDRDACNVYSDLTFPDDIYESINEYHQEKADAEEEEPARR